VSTKAERELVRGEAHRDVQAKRGSQPTLLGPASGRYRAVRSDGGNRTADAEAGRATARPEDS